MDEEQLALVQQYVANIAISGSTLRNQGAKGVVKIARAFLAELDLSVFCRIEPHQYSEQLNNWTEELRSQLLSCSEYWCGSILQERR